MARKTRSLADDARRKAAKQGSRPVSPAKKPKATRTGTPVRNSIIIIIFVAILALLVILLPKEPTRPSATLLAPQVTGGSGGIGGASSMDGDDIIGESTVASSEVPALRISEIMASNKSAYPDETGNYSDWIEIENYSDQPISMEGIGLSDRDDRILFLFPDITLEGGQRAVVFCDDTNVATVGKPFHARFKISALGETLYLFNTDAVAFDIVEVPPINSDISYALTDEGWVETDQFTPGYPNTAAGFATFRAEAVVSANGLVINEVLASNRTTLQDEDGEFPDWIELYNGGTLAIDLSNYAITDDETNLIKWRFPQGAIIQPGGYYVVFASGKDRPGGDGNLPHTNFKLGAEGETIVLSDILRQMIDRTTFDNLAQDTSWGRVPGLDNVWQVFLQPTPGLPNTKVGEIEMDSRMQARNTSGIFISEVLTSADNPVETPLYGATTYDWIELVNRSGEEIDLSNWGLSDKLSRPRKWQFAEGTTIKPGEHLLVFASGEGESPTGSGALHTTYRLSALGETIVLSDPEGNIYDKLVVPKLERGNSYGRNFDQGGLFYYEVPTAGAKNTSQGFSGYATAPTISMEGGVFTRPVTIALSAPDGVRIRYTLDGSNPTELNGTDYTEPIELKEARVLRARGFVDGLKPSDITTETFLVNVYHSLPIVSISIDPDELYDPDTGMFAEDEEVKASYEYAGFKKLTYWKKLPHPGNVEYFVDGKQVLNQGVELQLNGQYSMDQAQKSIRITARARYGASTLAYPFFSDRDAQEYQAVILRNGGQDGKYTRIIDGLQSKIIDWTGSDIMHMASTPIIAFINGEYWGHYNLRDRMNKHSIAAYEGWSDPEQIDFIKGENKVISGSSTDYKALIEYVKANDLNDPEALAKVESWVDIDNYFDFMIFQIYFGNTDAGNIKFYRHKTDPNSKWRWIVFDLDWGYFESTRDGCYVWLKEEGAGEKRFDNSLIRGLLAVPAMRDKFLARYGQLFQEVLSDTDRIREEADRMLATIEPELPLHFNRWAGLTSPVISEEPANPEGLQKYWSDRVSRMHNVLKKRPNLAWEHVKSFFELTDEQMIGYFGPQPVMPDDVL